MIAAAALADLGFALSWQVEERSLAPPVVTGEAALTRSAAKGDRKAFGQLVDAHKRAVYGLCFRLLREPEEARDAAQEAFARAYAALSTYDAAQPFVPWVLRIARNHCLDVLRRRLPDTQRVELDAEPDEGAPRELADPAAVRADDALERRQLAGALEAAVAALPQNYREVVHLFHVEHLSYKEIAATLDVPLGTVMTWLHRARARLKEALAEPGAENLR
ncbi:MULTISPECIES: RNA polymerase sigma factor [Anaeromyxobacter]|uniref:RNA polymerase sigma factor n=1 Tax=Anaeromyxobacter TaxID=161492 RepID=UPI001F55DDFB|nr:MULTISPECIES: sigma-70 family RNA polymerase sigma factor [unclassified Anaeromyxobacter]